MDIEIGKTYFCIKGCHVCSIEPISKLSVDRWMVAFNDFSTHEDVRVIILTAEHIQEHYWNDLDEARANDRKPGDFGEVPF